MSLTTLLGDLPAWMRRAACLHEPSRWWFDPRYEDKALRVCGRCEVRAECLAHALVHRETVGIWGGKTETERQEIVDAARSRAAHG